MEKGTRLEIKKYICAADVYQVIDMKHPDEGPFFAKRASLVQGVDTLKSAQTRIKKRPESIVEEIYGVDRPIPLLSFAEGVDVNIKFGDKKCPR